MFLVHGTEASKQEAACGIRVGNYKAAGRLHASPHPPEERSETHAISRHFTSNGGMIPEVTEPAEIMLKAKGMSKRENDKKETKHIRAAVVVVVVVVGGGVFGEVHFS
jgi:hypothetical protein